MSDRAALLGTVTGTWTVSVLPGPNTAVDCPFCVVSAQPIVEEIAMLNKSCCDPVLVIMKVRFVDNPGSVVLSAGVERVAEYSENSIFETLIC